MRRTFFFDRALLPGGWRRRVRLESDAGLIVSVQPDADPAAGDQREAMVIPGLPDLHSHAFQRAMAGLTERQGTSQDNFWSWREIMYRFVSRMDPDAVEAIASYAYADMLEAGFTTVGEFHYVHRTADGGGYGNPGEMGLRHLAAAEAVGLDITLLPVFYAASNFGGVAPTPGQKRFINSVDSFAATVAACDAVCVGRSDRRVGIAPHSLRAAPPEMLSEILKLKPNGPIHIHIAEQTGEVDACLAWSGQRPVEWLLANAAVDGRWCLVHATHMTPGETEAVARSGAVAGLCPITEANLGDGVFPAKAFLGAGGRFGVGSDSNVEIDAAGELRLLEYGQRLIHRARNVLSAGPDSSTGQRLFEGALTGGAQALALGAAGFTPGARSNFIVLDHEHPDLANTDETHLVDTWIFSTGRRAIRKVAVGGELVVENGRHRDRDRIDGRYKTVVARLLKDTGS
jgi:formimidoylglutamate deiminase